MAGWVEKRERIRKRGIASQGGTQAKVGENADTREGRYHWEREDSLFTVIPIMSNRNNRLEKCKRPGVGTLLYMCVNRRPNAKSKERKKANNSS